MSKDEFESQDDRDDVGIFIHSELDDYGLNPLEFRVYGRLARRAGKKGKSCQSVPHMAEEFGVHKRSVQRALQLLVLCGLTDAQIKPGRPTIYRLNPRRKWKDRRELVTIRDYVRNPKGAPLGAWVSKVGDDDPLSPGVRPEEPGCAPPQPYEGIPLKVLPEGTPSPLPPKGGNGIKSQKIPRREPDPEVAATQAVADDLLAYLENKIGHIRHRQTEAKEIKWLLEHGYDPQQCKACMDYLRTDRFWETKVVTWSIVAGRIGDWIAKGSPPVYVAHSNGNGGKSAESQRPAWMASEK